MRSRARPSHETVRVRGADSVDARTRGGARRVPETQPSGRTRCPKGRPTGLAPPRRAPDRARPARRAPARARSLRRAGGPRYDRAFARVRAPFFAAVLRFAALRLRVA